MTEQKQTEQTHPDLKIQDIIVLLKLIDGANKRGAFSELEIQASGPAFKNVQEFVKAVGRAQQAIPEPVEIEPVEVTEPKQ